MSDENILRQSDDEEEENEDEQGQIDEKHNLLLLQRELELIERDCEQLRRENALLQSWLYRKKVSDQEINAQMDDYEGESEYKTILSYNVKYEIATEELEYLQKDIEEGRTRSEAMIDELQAIIQHTKWNIAEIKKE